jgi:hypothetical protein
MHLVSYSHKGCCIGPHYTRSCADSEDQAVVRQDIERLVERSVKEEAIRNGAKDSRAVADVEEVLCCALLLFPTSLLIMIEKVCGLLY